MQFNIDQAHPQDYPILSAIWEASVRATHHFIPEEYILKINPQLIQYFQMVNLFTLSQEHYLVGFSGIAGTKIEMLFIRPEYFGLGAGTMLVRHALNNLGATQVDVNEQNIGACKFYKKLGFKIKSRSKTDSMGKPYPILHLEYNVDST